MKQESKRLQFEYINRKPIQLPLKRREILVYLDHISPQSLWSSQSSSQKVDRLWPFLQPGKIKLNRQKIGNAKNWQQLLFESTRNTMKILLQGKNKKDWERFSYLVQSLLYLHGWWWCSQYICLLSNHSPTLPVHSTTDNKFLKSIINQIHVDGSVLSLSKTVSSKSNSFCRLTLINLRTQTSVSIFSILFTIHFPKC